MHYSWGGAGEDNNVGLTCRPRRKMSSSSRVLYRVNGEKFRPLRWVEEDGAHAAVEPQSWQEALHLPGVRHSVVNFHLHAVVALHAFPMAAGDKQFAVQRYQAAVLVEHMEELDLRRGQRGNEDQKTRFWQMRL